MNIDRMISLTEGLTTKADKIRALHRAEYSRSQIADFLGIRYQHVRNTIVNDERAGYNPEIVPQPNRQTSHESISAAGLRNIEVDENGCALVPPDLLESLGSFEDDEQAILYALKVPGGLFVCTAEGLVARAATSFQ